MNTPITQAGQAQLSNTMRNNTASEFEGQEPGVLFSQLLQTSLPSEPTQTLTSYQLSHFSVKTALSNIDKNFEDNVGIEDGITNLTTSAPVGVGMPANSDDGTNITTNVDQALTVAMTVNTLNISFDAMAAVKQQEAADQVDLNLPSEQTSSFIELTTSARQWVQTPVTASESDTQNVAPATLFPSLKALSTHADAPELIADADTTLPFSADINASVRHDQRSATSTHTRRLSDGAGTRPIGLNSLKPSQETLQRALETHGLSLATEANKTLSNTTEPNIAQKLLNVTDLGNHSQHTTNETEVSGVINQLGISSPSNPLRSTNITQVPGSPFSPYQADFTQKLETSVKWMHQGQINHAEIKLHPEDLGPITVHLQLDGNQTKLFFGANNESTRHLLQEAMQQLQDSLNQGGLSLSQGQVGTQQQGQAFQEHMQQQHANAQATTAETQHTNLTDSNATETIPSKDNDSLIDFFA